MQKLVLSILIVMIWCPISHAVQNSEDMSKMGSQVRAGFVKLFAQVIINGKEIYVPFGSTVKAQ